MQRILPGEKIFKDISWIECCQGYYLNRRLSKILLSEIVMDITWDGGCQGYYLDRSLLQFCQR